MALPKVATPNLSTLNPTEPSGFKTWKQSTLELALQRVTKGMAVGEVGRMVWVVVGLVTTVLALAVAAEPKLTCTFQVVPARFERTTPKFCRAPEGEAPRSEHRPWVVDKPT